MRLILRHRFSVFVICLSLGLAGALAHAVWLKSQHSNQSNLTIAFEEMSREGFDEIASANNGEIVTVEGYIDIKGLCNRSDSNLCETYFGRGSEWQHIPIRLQICNDQIKINCITRMKVPVDFRDVWVNDKFGKQIDFDGWQLIEEPNTWMSKDQPLRISGRVTKVNGVGRFLEPIEIIGSAQLITSD